MLEEYRVHFVQQFNGERRRDRHGNVTLHVAIEKRLNGRVVDKARLGSIDLDMLDSVNDRYEFWKITDLYLRLLDIPTEVADMICAHLSQVVKPITEREVASYYGCSVRLRETMRAR
ncbi:MAG: hypothetical protein ACXV5H_01000 [Halobacteriota archaeon]